MESDAKHLYENVIAPCLPFSLEQNNVSDMSILSFLTIEKEESII